MGAHPPAGHRNAAPQGEGTLRSGRCVPRMRSHSSGAGLCEKGLLPCGPWLPGSHTTPDGQMTRSLLLSPLGGAAQRRPGTPISERGLGCPEVQGSPRSRLAGSRAGISGPPSMNLPDATTAPKPLRLTGGPLLGPLLAGELFSNEGCVPTTTTKTPK